jgi:hypothetical protein
MAHDLEENCSHFFDQSFIHSFIRSFVHQWLYSPLLDPGLFFSFVIFFTQTIRLLGWVISSSQGRYLHTGQQKHRINAHTNIHALSGIRTHDPSVLASEDNSCLRPHGHWDRLVITIPVIIKAAGPRSLVVNMILRKWQIILSYIMIVVLPSLVPLEQRRSRRMYILMPVSYTPHFLQTAYNRCKTPQLLSIGSIRTAAQYLWMKVRKRAT